MTVRVLAGGGGTEEVDPNFNLVQALYHFDGPNNVNNHTFLDSSGQGHTVNSNNTIAQGTFTPFSAEEGKWSVYFEGSDGNTGLQISDHADFNLGSGNFTAECWFYVDDDNGNYRRLFGVANSAGANASGAFQLDIDTNDYPVAYCYHSGGSYICLLYTSPSPRD